jgi:tetraprenyl-beta-curcumene synthase
MSNDLPIGVSQPIALTAVSARELAWVLPGVAREVRAWRERALAMPANPIRDDALAALDTKRFHTEGAALFATLPERRDPGLLRLLVAYELIWDYLDSVSERPCEDLIANGLQLHLAVPEALDPDAPISDYYRYHPWSDDGGYLQALVETCRRECVRLPGFQLIRSLVVREATRAGVCALNHEPDPERRDARLRQWARYVFPGNLALSWYELTAAASSSLAIHALLALATDPAIRARDVSATYAAYFPWVNLACIMLDSLADRADDLASGNHSYIAHYPSLDVAIARLQLIVRRSTELASRLPRGDRHALIPTGMAAMYLSKDSLRTPEMWAAAQSILRAPGMLPVVLWPLLRVWRRAYGQSSN